MHLIYLIIELNYQIYLIKSQVSYIDYIFYLNYVHVILTCFLGKEFVLKKLHVIFHCFFLIGMSFHWLLFVLRFFGINTLNFLNGKQLSLNWLDKNRGQVFIEFFSMNFLTLNSWSCFHLTLRLVFSMLFFYYRVYYVLLAFSFSFSLLVENILVASLKKARVLFGSLVVQNPFLFNDI